MDEEARKKLLCRWNESKHNLKGLLVVDTTNIHPLHPLKISILCIQCAKLIYERRYDDALKLLDDNTPTWDESEISNLTKEQFQGFYLVYQQERYGKVESQEPLIIEYLRKCRDKTLFIDNIEEIDKKYKNIILGAYLMYKNIKHC
ncbi:Hypothetical protein ORPV_63 [Orpheovirus IHUMI-LCC2]|uniref:Uncharacterized protein n=1 Tax=Orpheovirus IHUMI-LCC2 TaxID=2023057 RepID=A0A2I2L374_9VIRU|nr:Hypothetical protein ORPV_63 [Orpheovirus IHUMI-LCC2]SNW61967.1 Hypothetical protein ORPV_63 [Orpheovirus IHUMI-LCC2]